MFCELGQNHTSKEKWSEQPANLGFAVLWFLMSLRRPVCVRLSLRLQKETVRNGVGEEEMKRRGQVSQ